MITDSRGDGVVLGEKCHLRSEWDLIFLETANERGYHLRGSSRRA
jgi:hypothetical protein